MIECAHTTRLPKANTSKMMNEIHGVYPSQWIRAAISSGIIGTSHPINSKQIQPNSLDLRIGTIGYRVQCSFLPGEDGIAQKLRRYKWYEVEVRETGVVLEPNQVFIFPLCESLNLPEYVSGRANPKSTTGRLDVFTRLVTDSARAFDEVSGGYKGKLYLEVIPRTFAIIVRPGDTLAQLRFQVGDPYLSNEETQKLVDSDTIFLDSNTRVLGSSDLEISSGVILSVSIPKKNEPTVGYQARKNTRPIDLRKIGGARVRQHWDRIYGDSKPTILVPDEFYIFASRELVRLPPQYCAEMVPFDPKSGELRTHYAGFFDSGFGYGANRTAPQTAAAVVLEIRSRDVPFLIEDGQPLFRLNLLRNTEEPDFLYGSPLGSNYQSQRLRLSKHFVDSLEREDEDSRNDFVQPPLDFRGTE